MGFENPFKRFNKKEVGTAALAAAAVAGGIATGPVGPEMVKAFQPNQEKARAVQEVNPQDLQKMQTPEGMPQVTIDPEGGQAIVHMRPPGEGQVKNIDLSTPETTVDLKEKTYTFKAPE